MIAAQTHRGGRLRPVAAGAAAVVVAAGCGSSHAASTSRRSDIVPPPQTVRHVGGGTLGTQTSLGGVSVPFNPTYFLLTNFWTARRKPFFIEVYAGALMSQRHRGALIVNWTNPHVGLPTKYSGVYRAPRPAGPLTLANVRGNRVYFRYVGGSGTFDLKSRRFVLRR
ncbi:MAG: hypothetical protein E6G08_05535 [Actinobacteria bacterium]|nr:MAG: hypothetical protein E6G08_05535 [Actinomycetota bacterium]